MCRDFEMENENKENITMTVFPLGSSYRATREVLSSIVPNVMRDPPIETSVKDAPHVNSKSSLSGFFKVFLLYED